MNVFQWLSNPKPTMTGVEAANPAKPLPRYEMTGTPLPMPMPAQARLWSQSQTNPFPARSLVQQPPRMTVVA